MKIKIEITFDDDLTQVYSEGNIRSVDFDHGLNHKAFSDIIIVPMAAQLYYVVREKLGMPSHDELVQEQVETAINLNRLAQADKLQRKL